MTMPLTNTSESALLSDLSLDADGFAQYEREKFQRGVLEAVANGARFDLNLIGEGMLALRMNNEGNDECKIALGHMTFRVNIAALVKEVRVTERKGRTERADELLAQIRDREAQERAALERLAVRSDIAKALVAEMDNPPEGYYA